MDDDLAAVPGDAGGVAPQDDGKALGIDADPLQGEEVMVIEGRGHHLDELPAFGGPGLVALGDGEPGERIGRVGADSQDGKHVAAIVGSASRRVLHSWPAPFGAPHEPGGIRSSSGSAALRRAAPPPWTPGFSTRGPLPSERPTSQGGSAAHPAPLRSAGLLLPPGPPAFPLVARSFGASHEPGGIRSSSGSAALRRAAPPPWTPREPAPPEDGAGCGPRRPSR